MSALRSSLRPVARPIRLGAWHAAIRRDARAARVRGAQLAVFHDFAPAPAGGGNQTLRALIGEVTRRGVRVECGAASASTKAVLFNSFNFDVRRLEWFAARLSDDCRLVHRVGAVTSLYRGVDDGTDAHVAELNRRFADATIAISQATIDMYGQIGIALVDARVIHNPVDGTIFHPEGHVAFDRSRKIRLISSSWSDNPNKGAPVYKWLEDQLDWNRFEFTFVGRTPVEFERIRHCPPLPSGELADLLRQHHIFVTATRHDAYSNALVEALSCGLPAIYFDSGGSREAVKDAGFGFVEQEEIPPLLDRLVDEYADRQAAISLPTLTEIVDDYLVTLGLGDFVGG